MQVQFPSLKVCQYCDREIHGTAWVSFAGNFSATLCSPQCKELYDRAAPQQLVLPFKGWDVT